MTDPNEGFVKVAPRWRIAYSHAKARKVEGKNGQALDLSASAILRKATSQANPLKDHSGDFTVSVWVKGDLLSGFGNRSFDLIAATHDVDDREVGWRIGVQASGAWYWQVTEESYSYEPTAIRQSIRDDQWHLLSFSYSAEQPEFRLYYDGLNVGIYSVSLNQSWNQAQTLWIGGEPKNDSDCESFPGLIDEIWIYDRTLTAREIGKLFSQHRHLEPLPERQIQNLKVMTFNIWNGGREMGAEIGVQRVIDVIKDSGADLIMMQETYGSGPIIADALGYYFYLRSSNLSILSRYPIMETYPYYQAFHCGGARIQINKELYVNVFSIWLHYLSDYLRELYRNADLNQVQLLEGEQERLNELIEIIKEIEPLTVKSEQEPLLLCGDFNSGSHLDWIEATRSRHNGYVFPFPQSLALTEAGFRDTYREIHPDPVADPAITWPVWELNDYINDRIDYIYLHGTKLQPQFARKIDTHSVRFPSDHAAVLVDFRVQQANTNL
ncbi:LamG-like jellyroll fold domain-containing protein [Paenibacillus thermotolerans]|uniref:LamG-like jellyroll fold domain-containing protein n=1 Tax=Paenibacillus thermotolerans TaxID=3027807 RepID=UPI002367D02B|nr:MULTISPECIES: LamG-like jellyroll fold domain-containing protein [unclassified Paenibacillus]